MKNQKKITLFSKDADKELDESGKRYNKYTWNNINLKNTNNLSKMSICSLDFKSSYEPFQTNTVVRYNFEEGFNDISSNKYDAINQGNLVIERNIVKNGVGSVRFQKVISQGLYIDQNSDKLYKHLYQNLAGITIGFWYRPVTGGNQNNLGRFFYGIKDTNNIIQLQHSSSVTNITFSISINGVSKSYPSTVTANELSLIHI